MSHINSLISKEYYRILENSMNKNTQPAIRTAIKEEIKKISETVHENSDKIKSALESVRKELLNAGRIREYTGATNERAARPHCRIPLENVSKVIDTPINELLLYFLNGQRLKNEAELVEYSQGNVLFFGELEKMQELK